MIRVAIIEDELDSRDNLKFYLTELFDDIELVGEAENVESGIQLIKSSKPELVFLDVNMPDGTGFDLLESVSKEHFAVIFITAFDKHAVNAFRYSAIDFLLKPIAPEQLTDALEKYRKGKDLAAIQERIMNLLENKNAPVKIALPTTQGFKFVLTENIRRCESDGGYSSFYLYTGEKILVCRPLKEYDELLGKSGFLRVHQSHLVNLKSVKEYKKGDGGSAILDDGTEVYIARRRKEAFLSAMMNRNE